MLQIIANERVQIVNNNNGERLETYIIKGARGSGVICLNGAADPQSAGQAIFLLCRWLVNTMKPVFTSHFCASGRRSKYYNPSQPCRLKKLLLISSFLE